MMAIEHDSCYDRHTKSLEAGEAESLRQGAAPFWAHRVRSFTGGMGGCAVGTPGSMLSTHQGPEV